MSSLGKSGNPKRSIAGCLNCRYRKVKCDERRLGNQGCIRCEKKGLYCSFQTGVLDRRRNRVKRACFSCRTKKRRCSGDFPVCSRCTKLDLKCVYEDNISGSSSISSDVQTSPSNAEPNATVNYREMYEDIRNSRFSSIVHSLLDEFFETDNHFLAGNFIHYPSFITHVQDEGAPDYLLKAVVGNSLAARYKGDKLVKWWFEQLQSDLIATISDVSIHWLQAFVIFLISPHPGHDKRLFFLSPLATRLVHSLALNHPAEGMSELDNEIRNRTFWNCFVLDRLLAGGIQEFTMIDETIARVPYPHDHYNEVGKSPANSSIGLVTYFIETIQVRHRILTYTKKAVKNMYPWWESGSEFWTLSADMDNLVKSLPPDLEWNNENLGFNGQTLSSQKSVGFAQYFFRAHMYSLQSFCDLYRLALPGMIESTPQIMLDLVGPTTLIKLQRACISRAIAICFNIREKEACSKLQLGNRAWTFHMLRENTRLLIAATRCNSSETGYGVSDIGQTISNNLRLMVKFVSAADPSKERDIAYLLQRCHALGLQQYIPDECVDISPLTENLQLEGGGRELRLPHILSPFHPLKKLKSSGKAGENEVSSSEGGFAAVQQQQQILSSLVGYDPIHTAYDEFFGFPLR